MQSAGKRVRSVYNLVLIGWQRGASSKGPSSPHNTRGTGKWRFFPENASTVFPSYCVGKKLKKQQIPGNHMIVITSSFSESSVFKMFWTLRSHLRPPHTSRFFVGRQKVFPCRLVCGEFRQVCATRSGLVGRYLTVLDLKTSCRALSASVWWAKTICRGSRVNQPVRNCHESHVNTRLFQHGGHRLGPKPKRG